MQDRDLQIQLGFGAIAASVFLLAVAIPGWVSTPSNVPNIVLSPLFWPNTLAVLTGIVGLAMVLTSWKKPDQQDDTASDVGDQRAAYVRLMICAVIMGITIFAMPRLGLVWTSMLVFASTAMVVRTSHPKTAMICAVLIPLLLYVFFAHVAGVAIPQGDYVRLP